MKEKALDFLLKINDLQKTTRYGNNPEFSESTADHTFKLILMVDYFYQILNLNLDYQKCIHLATYHDFGEMDLDHDVDLKDSTIAKNQEDKKVYEHKKIEELSKKYYEPIEKYFDEYEDRETEEARFIYACDKLEGMIHPLTVGLPIMNHELFATYADKAVKNFPKLMPIYKQIKDMLKIRFEEWGFEWKKEYDSIFE
ncbi:MAG: HD domain-containing protein [Ruminococcus sp.]|nr:HD domain-containing protein [Ruminococcus sp.]